MPFILLYVNNCLIVVNFLIFFSGNFYFQLFQDQQVPYKTSLQLAEKLAADDVTVVLRKKGDHRLSKLEDIKALFEQLGYLLNKSNDCQKLATDIYNEVTID